MLRLITTALLGWVSVASVLIAEDKPAPAPDQRLQNAIMPLIDQHAGEVAVAIRNLKTREHFRYQANKAMPTASLIKLPLMIAVYREADAGRMDLSVKVALTQADKVPGSGVLSPHFSDGVQLTIRDYIRLMMRYSDNTATNIVIDQIGLQRSRTVIDQLGCPNTNLHSKIYRRNTSIDPAGSAEFGIGSTTASEMVTLLQHIHFANIASKDSCEAMLDHLKSCENRGLIGRYVPANVAFAHKTGGISNCRTDAGILFTTAGPIAVCVLTNKNEDQSWGESNAAERLMADIGRSIIDRFGANTDSMELRQGAFGKLVETLQRTLNARLTPSPNLSIDGDFGPATKRALIRFQESNQLNPTGVVTKKVWETLGSLIEEDAPIPAPSQVNNAKLPVRPRPPLKSPPIVTCKSWVIGDPHTGEPIFHSESDAKLEPASTTKIMTAMVVLELAREQTKVLDEVVTFSKLADDTVGSTAAIRVGEQVTVRQLLYGLLLPSGNDASVALAEHFGKKLRPNSPSSDKNASDYQTFVDQMNLTAQKIGLSHTHYQNPHGLSDAKHVTSSSDLLRLASLAMKDPLFQRIVNTRQYGCTLQSINGYTRNVLWKNTNRLLGIEGYSGVKTGTTSTAGACLVAFGEHDGDKLITVVLGSSSSEARYADARNLFRWAWAKRAADRPPEELP